jgi:hypothetical protein
MRIAIAVFLLVHGGLHLIGGLRRDSEQWRRGGWLAATLLLGAAGIACALDADLWRALAAAGVLLSEVMIVCNWQEAKAGTWVNVLLAGVVLVAHGQAALRRESARQWAAFTSRPSASAGADGPDLAALPAPVRRWLESSGALRGARPTRVELTQVGELHTSAKGAWMPVEARQIVDLDDPAFLWLLRGRAFAVLPLDGRDSWRDGRGRMYVVGGGWIPFADAQGPEIDRGALLRFLAEMIWYPAAITAPYLRWDAIDEEHARATLRHGGIEDAAVFTIDSEGRVRAVEARRPYAATGRLEPWGGVLRDWQELGGVRVPVVGEVVWHLAEGDFVFYRWRLTARTEVPRAEAPRPTAATLPPQGP